MFKSRREMIRETESASIFLYELLDLEIIRHWAGPSKKLHMNWCVLVRVMFRNSH